MAIWDAAQYQGAQLPTRARSNPFSGLVDMLSGGGMGQGGGGMAPSLGASPTGSQMAPSSRSSQRPNQFRPGTLMWMLSGGMGAPSEQEYQQQQFAGAQGPVAAKVQEAIAQGKSAQQAILEVMQTPEGQDYFASGGDLKGLANIGQLASDPLAGRKASFGRLTGQPGAPAAPTAGGDAWGGMRQPGTIPAAGASATAAPPDIVGFDDYLDEAAELAAQGDDEGAKIALGMAEEARLRQAQTNPVDPNSVQEYKFYVADETAKGGSPLSYYDWSISEKRAAVDPTAIDPSFAKAAIESTAAADSAEQQYQEMALFGTGAEGVNTGMFQAVTLPVAEAFRSIGIELNKQVPLLQALQAQQNQMALRLRNPESGFGLTGNTSNFDLQFLKAAVPGIDKSPRGNEAIMIIMGAKLRRQAQIERAKADYIFENKTLAGWGDARKALVGEGDDTGVLGSMLTDEEVQTLSDIRVEAGMSPVKRGALPTVDTGGTTDKSSRTPPATFMQGNEDEGLRQRAWELMPDEKKTLWRK